VHFLFARRWTEEKEKIFRGLAEKTGSRSLLSGRGKEKGGKTPVVKEKKKRNIDRSTH